MKRLLSLCCCLFSVCAYADCNKGEDSWVERLTLKNQSDLTQSSAIEVITKVARKHCTDDSMLQVFPFTNINCREIMPGNPSSQVCYLESKVGYFFVTMDMLDHYFVTYNRWD
jgi:hypothetical protein